MLEGTQPSAVPAGCAGRRVCFVPCFALVIHLSRPASQAQDPKLSKGELFRGSEQRKMQSPGWCRSEDVGFALPKEHCNIKAFWPLMSFLAAAFCRLEMSREVTKTRLRVAIAREFGVSKVPPAFLSFSLEMCSKASSVFCTPFACAEERMRLSAVSE